MSSVSCLGSKVGGERVRSLRARQRLRLAAIVNGWWVDIGRPQTRARDALVLGL